MNYPSIQEVETADRVQLFIWGQSLPIPHNEFQSIIHEAIFLRLNYMYKWDSLKAKATPEEE